MEEWKHIEEGNAYKKSSTNSLKKIKILPLIL